MYCRNCGSLVDEGDRFCMQCGAAQQGTFPEGKASTSGGAAKPQNPTPNKAVIAALVVAAVAVNVLVLTRVFPALGNVFPSAGLLALDSGATSAVVGGPAPSSSSSVGGGGVSTWGDDQTVPLADAEVGDVVSFGSFPAGESIEWAVLDVEGDHVLLLSKKALDCRPMSAELSYNYDITWERSDVRSWLNDSFLDDFTDEERASLDITLVDTSHDDDTYDQVFLLSMAECEAYVDTSLMRAEPTAYAVECGAKVFDDYGTVYWWLRDYSASHANVADDNYFAVVFSNGEVNDLGYLATTDELAIRPAVWVNRTGAGEFVDYTTGVFYTEDYLSQLGDAPVSYDDDEVVDEVLGENTVLLEVEARDGSVLSGSVRRDDDDYVIYDSSSYEYSMDELVSMGLTDAELCVAWNEPFARQGYHFKNSGLQTYFESCSWYVDQHASITLTGAASHNNTLLRQLAERSTYGKRWIELASD